MKVIVKKLGGMYQYILPPYLSIIYLFANRINGIKGFIEIGCFLLASLCIACLGYAINDLADIQLDKDAGKQNIFIPYNKSATIWLFALSFFLASSLWFCAKPTVEATILVIAEIVLFIVYSLKPCRFKNNPIIGPLCDAHYAHILPVFVTLSFLQVQLSNIVSILLYLVLITKGLRNILSHQIHDRKADATARLKTFPLFFGTAKTLKTINFFIFPLEFIFITLLVFFTYPSSKIFAISFAVFQVFNALLFSFWHFHTIPLKYFHFKFVYYLNNYYEFWLPLVCIFNSGLTMQTILLLQLTHLLVFHTKVWSLFKDLRTIFYNILPKKYS